MARIKDRDITFKETILPLWLPVLAVVGLVLPANFSTAALIFLMVLIITFIGGYPIKYLLSIIGAGIVILGVFILTDRKSTRLNSSHVAISYAVFCLKKKTEQNTD